MDTSKPTGISIRKINLIACKVENLDSSAKLKYNLGIVDLKRQLSEDGLTLVVTATFDIMQGVEKPLCDFLCTLFAEYRRKPNSNMTWEEFTDVMTVAHLLPYVREFVSGVTLRMPVDPLVIPPTNVSYLLKKYHERKAAPVQQPTKN
jgi:preprotein translocase subunit SecB